MRDFLDSSIFILLVAFIVFVIALALGFHSAEKQIVEDCKLMGQFRIEDMVFRCSQQ